MTIRITVSLPDEIVHKAQQAVAAGQAASVSAYVADAISEKQHGVPLGELLAAWDAELGRPSDEVYAWAEAELDRTDAEWAAQRTAKA
ncbi:hypothetical protein Back2_08970 [Nocardioides baekrokdamisoli]|uniref:CopG family transcriptional regulator n=1 Tax=Nocardioides baekrokdamisoli TaxID=1804624 RepID=A0A3G9ICE5_9ACTN|nr:toxin-antitoxin system antitoxin subunit [Nocardioides baekrokdamisoli]BBH16610.1 hypothetical protein Back2_08970 [Nocardioides baekrokdamisoli]